jgi:hypothetical protein
LSYYKTYFKYGCALAIPHIPQIVSGMLFKYDMENFHLVLWGNYIFSITNPHDIGIGNRCFENVADFRCLGTTVTNQNLIQEENRGD